MKWFYGFCVNKFLECYKSGCVLDAAGFANLIGGDEVLTPG